MSVQVVFRVSTGSSLDGDSPGTGGAIDISRKLSLVGSIPELGAWSLNKRIPCRTKPHLGEFERDFRSKSCHECWSKPIEIADVDLLVKRVRGVVA